MPSTSESKPKLSADELASLISTLQLEMLSVKTRLAESETRNESLQETIVNLAHENELLKRRLFGTKSERLRTSENQLALGNLLPRLLEQLAIARASADYSAMLERLAKIDILILDDFLLAPMTDVERRDLLEVLEDRYGKRRVRGWSDGRQKGLKPQPETQA